MVGEIEPEFLENSLLFVSTDRKLRELYQSFLQVNLFGIIGSLVNRSFVGISRSFKLIGAAQKFYARPMVGVITLHLIFQFLQLLISHHSGRLNANCTPHDPNWIISPLARGYISPSFSSMPFINVPFVVLYG